MPNYTGSETITAENLAATKDHATTRKTLSTFNNLTVKRRDPERGWIIDTTKATAEAIARDFAMNVTHIDGSTYAVKRRYPYRITGANIDA